MLTQYKDELHELGIDFKVDEAGNSRRILFDVDTSQDDSDFVDD